MKETKPNFPELYMKQTETDSAYDGTNTPDTQPWKNGTTLGRVDTSNHACKKEPCLFDHVYSTEHEEIRI